MTSFADFAKMRVDPYTSETFLVEIDGILIASFSEVSGINSEIETEDYKEGGRNEFVHKLPRQTKNNNLVLKRGVTDSSELYQWYNDVSNGKIQPRDVNIFLRDMHKTQLKSWLFKKAFPVKWSASDLNAQGNNILIETLELVHQGMETLK